METHHACPLVRGDQLSPAVAAARSWTETTSCTEEVPLTVRHGAKALVSDSTEVLLVEERREDGSTFWSLPGGGVEPGESLRAGVRRELAEELQCRSTVGGLVGRCLYRHRSIPETVTLYSVFAAQPLTTPEVNHDEGIIAYRWCDPADPPRGLLEPFHHVLRNVYWNV